MNRRVPSSDTGEVDAFQHKLKLSGEDYLLESKTPAGKVHLQFEGELEGVAVVWHACVQTIKDYSKSNLLDDDPRQFIHIELNAGLHKLNVALNLEQIDQPALERTIIMIRKYKKLSVGYHEYGARSKTE